MKKIFIRISAAVTAAAFMTSAIVFDIPEILSTIVSAATAAHTAHKICINSVCGITGITESNICEHDAETAWTKWQDRSSCPTGGTYYLDTDITLSGTVRIASGETLNLCLNGHTVKIKDGSTYTPFFNISSGGTLNLCDCKGGGQLTGAKETSNTGAVNAYGAFNMYGGAITECTGNYGGVHVGNYDTSCFKMYGGSISNNTAEDGSGVYSSGQFYMYGGAISDNQDDGAGRGSAVQHFGTKLELYGGTISGNSGSGAVSGSRFFTIYGAEIINNNCTGVFSSTGFDMYGGRISGNSGDTYGGVSLYNNGSTFNMYGGEISGNSGTNVGGVNVSNGSIFNMYGGSITGNKATNSIYNGGGVVFSCSTGGNLCLDGPVNISGNTNKNNEEADLYLYTRNAIITIGENFDPDNSKVGFQLSNGPSCTEFTVFAKNLTRDVRNGFFINRNSKNLLYFAYENGKMSLAKYHQPTATAAVPATCTEKGNIAYWTCSSCNKIFTDSDCTAETTQSGTVTDALGHDFSSSWTKSASEHWHVCNRSGCSEKKRQGVPYLRRGEDGNSRDMYDDGNE